MRVLCSTIDENDVEGEVIGGDSFDPITEMWDFESTFTVRCDDGALFEVCGWLVDVTIVGSPRLLVVM